MGYDKYLAKNNKWRISENTFIFLYYKNINTFPDLIRLFSTIIPQHSEKICNFAICESKSILI